MFDQLFKLFGIMVIPWCGGEPVYHTSVDIDTDVKFDTVLAFSISFDSDVVPDAAVMGTESCAVHCDVHLFPSEKPGDSVHHLAYVGDGESFHSSVDDAVPRDLRVVLFYDLAVFHLCLDTVVGLVESYFEKTTCCNGFRVVPFPAFFVGFPGWWHTVNRFDYRLGEFDGEVAVYMVSNCWVYPFFSTSHLIEKMNCFFPNYLFRDEAFIHIVIIFK